jgi:hypothetical protein
MRDQRGTPAFGPAGTHELDCARCGHVDISEEAEGAIQTLPLKQRAAVWGFLRQARLERPKQMVKVREPMIQQIVSAGPRSISEKLDRLLQNLASASEFGGHEVELQMERDFPMGNAANDKEFVFLLRTLVENKLLSHDVNKPHLTAAGWSRVTELSRTGASADQAFVAMRFDPSLDEAYENGIKRGIEDAGYRPYRVDLDDFAE